MDDPEEDRDRKSKFWSQLEDIVFSHSNQSHLLIHIGPHVVGVRASISDEDRDNATMMYDFLQSHNFTLPQTFTQLPVRQSVSSKETTCSDNLLSGDNPRDWTTLDYLMCPPLFTKYCPLGALFFNRQSLRTSKQDYRSMSDFYGAVEHSLLSSPFLPPPS